MIWWMIPFVCMCCALAPSSMATQQLLGYEGNYGYEEGPGNGVPPGAGDCNNAGVIYADNPYQGWPVEYKPGDWSIVTFYYCNIYPDGSPHWGIDLGLDEQRIVVTTQRAVVRQAEACDGNSTCWNYGMGRYVQIEAQIPVNSYDQCVADHGGNLEANECWADSGWLATYMHLKEVRVDVGQIVHREDGLGITDNSGNSTGPHLHYQINSPTAGAVDPAPTMR